MRHNGSYLFVRELSFNTINQAIAIEDLRNDDDGMEHQNQEPQPRRSKEKPDNGTGTQQFVPEGNRFVALIVRPIRGLFPNPVGNMFHYSWSS